MKLRVLLQAALVLIGSGCSSVAIHRVPGDDVRKYQHFFVEHKLSDDHRVDDVIVAELRALGKDASDGPLTMMPDRTDVIVSYDDQWAWDFKDYLLQLNLEMHDIRKERLLATGVYRQPTPLTKPPEYLVHAILTRLFKSH